MAKPKRKVKRKKGRKAPARKRVVRVKPFVYKLTGADRRNIKLMVRRGCIYLSKKLRETKAQLTLDRRELPGVSSETEAKRTRQRIENANYNIFVYRQARNIACPRGLRGVR